MTVWLVRAGPRGEQQEYALKQGIALIGWNELPDLTGLKERADLDVHCRSAFPGSKDAKLNNWAGQIWAFARSIREGDLIALPLKGRGAIAFGKVRSPYQFRTDLVPEVRHTRAVEWTHPDIPRTRFDQDLLHSLGAFMTVCRIERNDAEARILAILGGKAAPLRRTKPHDPEPDDDEHVDLENNSRDLIRSHIVRRFGGHGLERLVTGILRAQGYTAKATREGADGGVDVIAGRGPLGFDAPRLCVQVKSGDSALDVKPLRELQGVLKNFGADQGLLVSLGGFKSSVYDEARRLFFQIRLWDADDLITELLAAYPRLSDDLKAEIPLKQIWTLVPEDESE